MCGTNKEVVVVVVVVVDLLKYRYIILLNGQIMRFYQNLSLRNQIGIFSIPH